MENPRDGGTIYPWNDKDRPSAITVSAQREPLAIARDIERRYLQAYLAAFRMGVELLNKARAHEQAKKDLATRLAKLCGESLHASGLEFSQYRDDCFHLQVRVDHPDCVRLTINDLHGELAEAVLQFVLQQATPRPEGTTAP
jgi:predicted RecB family endonuclease